LPYADKPLSILSFGFTRSLFDENGTDDTRERLLAYAEHLGRYVVVVNSYRAHRLQEARLGRNLQAIPTNARNAPHSFLRMLGIGARQLWALRGERVLVQAQDPAFTGLVAALLGLAFRRKVNVCVYGPNPFDPHWIRCAPKNRFLAPIGRWVMRRAAGIQVDGKMTASSLRAALPGMPIRVKPLIPNGLGRFLDLPLDRPEEGPVRFLFIGRLDPQKNLPMLASVFRKLQERLSGGPDGPKAVLEVVGTGQGDARLRAELAPVAHTVRFHGSVPYARLPEHYGNASVLLLTSWYEGYPRVLMEAAAAGLPIVSTAVSGSDDAIVDGVSGHIVPIADEEAFVSRLECLVKDANGRRAMGAAARRHAHEKMNPQGNNAMQIRIWRELIDPPAGGRGSRALAGVAGA
jgi:glycosyltransferase involved in cell wall biosynthesis